MKFAAALHSTYSNIETELTKNDVLKILEKHELPADEFFKEFGNHNTYKFQRICKWILVGVS